MKRTVAVILIFCFCIVGFLSVWGNLPFVPVSGSGMEPTLISGSLLLVEPGRARRAEFCPAERHRAGRHEDHILPACPAGGDVGGQLLQPGMTGVPVLGDQGRSDLNDDAFCMGEGVSCHGAQRYMSAGFAGRKKSSVDKASRCASVEPKERYPCRSST